MLRHSTIHSPLLCALVLGLGGCQPRTTPEATGEPSPDDRASEILGRAIPTEPGVDLVFPPPGDSRRPRAALSLDEESATVGGSDTLEVRWPHLDDDGAFEIQGRCLRVVFTQSIDLPRKPSTKRPLAADPKLFTISPEVAGSARWTASNVLEFCADDHLDPEATYSLTVAGPTSRDGALSLAAPWTAKFTATIAYETAGKTLSYLPQPGETRVLGVIPRYGDRIGPRDSLAVIFDQPVTLETAAAQLRLEDEAGAREVTLRHHRSRTFDGANVDPKQVVFVRPKQAPKAGESLTLRTWDFEGPGNHELVREFTVVSPLEITEVSCGYSYGAQSCELEGTTLRTNTSTISLSFNNALAATSKEAKAKISVSPPVRNFNVWVNNDWDGGGGLRISGEFEPSRRYTLSVAPLVDRYGSSMRAPLSWTVETAPLDASVSIPEGTLLLDEAHSRGFAVTTRNVARGELLLWAIADGDPEALKKARADMASRSHPRSAPDHVIPFAPTPLRDDFTTTAIDLLAHGLRPGRTYVTTVRMTEMAFGAAPVEYPSWSSAGKPPVILLTPADNDTIALHVHATADATVLQAARLHSGEPVAGARVTIDGEAVAGKVTDAHGVVVLPLGGDRARAAVLGVTDGDGRYAQLQLAADGSRERQYFPSLTSSSAIRLDDLRALVITDRGIYRPGSTVWIKGSVRRQRGGAMAPAAAMPVRLRVLGPMGDEVMTTTTLTNELGSVASSFEIPGRARLGDYELRIEDVLSLGAGSAGAGDTLLASSRVKIAEFEAPRFTVDVEATSPSDGEIAATVTGRYLFGAAMDGSDVEWTLTRAPASLPAGTLADAGLRFERDRRWRWDEDLEDRWSRASRGKLGANGTLTIRERLDLEGTITPQRFTLEAGVTDSSYRSIAGRASVLVHPFARYAGVAIPQPWSDIDRPLPVSLGVVDREGKAVTGATIGARLEHIRWTYSKTRAAGGHERLTWHRETSEVDRCEVTSAATAVSCELTPRSSGEYRVVTEVDGHPGGEASLWAWGRSRDQRVVVRSEGRTIDLVSDRPRYAPGDVAKILVRSPFTAATAILTVEQGGLLTHESVAITGSTHLFEVPITAEHAPHLHAVVTLLPRSAEAASRAEWKLGALRLPVSAADARLEVAVTSDRERYEPGDEAKIVVSVRDGERPVAGAEIALAVVDEGILRMTNFHAADPVLALRPGMPLRFEIGDTRSNLAQLLGLSQTAGDGMASEDSGDARKNFLETALWRPDLRTDSDGLATAQLTLPDNLTRWRMMAVVLDAEGKGGNAENSFTVRKPLMMIPALPRFAAVGDTFEAAAMVHNNEETPQRATVSLGDQSQEVVLAASGRQRVGFPITAETAGELPLHFRLRDGGGKTHDAVELRLPVDAPGIGERPRLDGAFVGSQRILLRVPTAALVGRDSNDFIGVRVGQHLWPELGARLEFLLDYPHGCVEQTTSGLLPLLAAREILPRLGFTRLSPAELDLRIKAGVDRLATMRTASGGLGYWPGDSTANVYGTAYAIRALILATQAGISLPDGLLNDAAGFLEDQLFSVSEPEVQAAIAHSLAELGKLAPSALDALFDRRDRQGVFGLASLALAFSSFPEQEERTTELLGLLEASFDENGAITRAVKSDDFYYYGSPTRSKAQAAIALGRLRHGSPLHLRLAQELSDLHAAYTTQATAYTLLALAEQLRHAPEDGAKFQVTLDGKTLSPSEELGSGALAFTIPLAELRGREATLELTSESSAALAFMVDGRWKRALADATSLAATTAPSGPELYRVVTDGAGNPVDLNALRPGQVLRVSILAKLPVGQVEWNQLNHLAITDRLPAGLEPVQTDLWTVARAPELTDAHPFYSRLRWGGSDASFLEMHDDRVQVYFDRVWGDAVVATYLVRTLTPGSFVHPPAEAEFMYLGDSTSYSASGRLEIQ